MKVTDASVARLASAKASGDVRTESAPTMLRQASSAAANSASPGKLGDLAAPRFDVLLLAPDAGNRAMLSRVLVAHCRHVDIAANPVEAQRLLLQNDAAGIAVLDLHCASFSGTDVYAEMCQRLPRDRELAVIFLARSPSVNDVVRALRLGAVDLLRSPVHPEHLLDAVARASSALARQAVLRQCAAAVNALTAEMHAQTSALLSAVRTLPKLRARDDADGTVEFTETLDWQAQHEDVSSLPYTQRQRRRVSSAIKDQARRREVLGGSLVDDFACWDMLLDLHQGSLAGRGISVSSLCSATSVPVTTALRRLDEMLLAGLITRTRDSADRRRVMVRLTEQAAERLRRYFDVAGPGP